MRHEAIVEGRRLRNVHPPEACEGEYCTLHHPSDHHMRAWPLHWRDDIGMFERICEHGIGHWDPDSVAYRIRITGDETHAWHGCDGCCEVPA